MCSRPLLLDRRDRGPLSLLPVKMDGWKARRGCETRGRVLGRRGSKHTHKQEFPLWIGRSGCISDRTRRRLAAAGPCEEGRARAPPPLVVERGGARQRDSQKRKAAPCVAVCVVCDGAIDRSIKKAGGRKVQKGGCTTRGVIPWPMSPHAYVLYEPDDVWGKWRGVDPNAIVQLLRETNKKAPHQSQQNDAIDLLRFISLRTFPNK